MIQRLMAAAAATALLGACAIQETNKRPSPQEGQGQGRGQGRGQITQKAPPVIVTARKWKEQQAQVPRSVTTIGSSQIRDAGLDSIKDASQYVPNTLITEFSSRRLSFPFVRGVGSGQGDPAVATFIDGVPQLQVSSTNLPLLDVERIEFLRGPHGALYGRNTIGGAIHVISRQPSSSPRFDAGVKLGNFDSQDYRISGSTALVEDQLFVTASVLHSERDGYTENDLTGNDVDSRDGWFGRVQLQWTPDEENEVRLMVYGESANDGGFVLSDLAGLRSRPNHISQDFEGHADRHLNSTALVWNHYGVDLDFTSITAVQDWDISESSDFDFSALDGLRRTSTADQTYVSQEFRLSSAEDDQKLKWLLGVSGFYSDSSQEAANDFRPGGSGILYFPPQTPGIDRASGAFDSHAAAIFGQARLALGEQWDLTGALRYDFESKEAKISRVFETGGFSVPVSNTTAREDFDELLPRLSLTHRPSDDLMAYALAARGFKAGGFNLTSPAGQASFGPETSWTYELGARARMLDDRLSTSLAAFYIDWDAMQLSQFDATSGGFVTNAGESRSQGVELEVKARPCDDLELFGGIGYLDTEFKSFTDQFGQDVSGKDLPFAPETTANLGAQYSVPLKDELRLFIRAEYFRVGRFYYDAGNRAGEHYELANFRLGCGCPRLRFEGWVRNAFDERYAPVAFQANPSNPNTFVGESGAPLTYGVMLTVTF